MDFTYDEQQLMAIYNGGTREETIAALEQMRPHLGAGADDADLLALTDSALEKLSHMTDEEFDKLDLTPDFGGEEDAG